MTFDTERVKSGKRLVHVVTREEARRRGLKRYYTGEPCKRGHISERYCSTHQCVECQREHRKRYYDNDPEKYRAASREWTADNKETVARKNADYRARNLEYCKEMARRTARESYRRNRDKCIRAAREWAQNNRERRREISRLSARRNVQSMREWRKENVEKVRRYGREWSRRNRDYARSALAAYRAAKESATPSWADLNKILAIYRRAHDVAQRTGIEVNVDHIVPLRSKIVCGLHVEDNLRIIDADKNRRKSNKYWPDMP